MHGNTLPAASRLPTHTDFLEFLLTILPTHARDVPLIYHEPRFSRYNPSTTPIRDVVLSITPTPGVYRKLEQLSATRGTPKPVCFLHRPFNLDRRAVPKGVLVAACHKRFDEVLTVGWNTGLATRLGLDVSTAICLQGYKGDPERRIGLVARCHDQLSLGIVHSLVLREFGVGEVHPSPSEADVEKRIDGIAIMNAFGPDEVARAVDSAVAADIIGESAHARLVYLTGETKEAGLAALRDQYNGMTAVCVGHRPAEEWGIKYLNTRMKEMWSGVNVHMVFEDEEEQQPRKQPTLRPVIGADRSEQDVR